MVTPEILPTPAGPADILIAGWDIGKPAALDLTITGDSQLLATAVAPPILRLWMLYSFVL